MRILRYVVTAAAGVFLATSASAQSTGSMGGTTQGDSNTGVYGGDTSDRGSSGSMGGSDTHGTGSTGSPDSSGSLGGATQEQGSFGSDQQGEQISGVVSKVDEGELRISTDTGEDLTLKTDEQTTFLGQQGEVQSLQDIQEGQQIRASYRNEEGDNQAVSIEVLEQDSGSMGGSQDSGGSMGGSEDSSGSMGGDQGGTMDDSGSTGGSQSDSDFEY